MSNKVMVLVPYSIAEVLRRNRLSLSSILDYKQMRQLVSVDDLSAFYKFQKAERIELLRAMHSNYLLTSWEQNRTSDERTELASVVVPISPSEDGINYIYETLSRSVDEEYTSELPYDVVDLSREAFALVVKPGFMDVLKDTTKTLELLQCILKVFYGYLQVHEVSSLPIYAKYVQQLEASEV